MAKKNNKKVRGEKDYRSAAYLNAKCEVCRDSLGNTELIYRNNMTLCWQCSDAITYRNLRSTERTIEYERQLRLQKGLPPKLKK